MPRAKLVKDVRHEARKHTAMAIKTLVHIAAQPNAPAASRVAAAQALMDRGWGKPKQEVEVNQEVTLSLADSLAKIAQLEHREMRDVTPTPLSKEDSDPVMKAVIDQVVSDDDDDTEPDQEEK